MLITPTFIGSLMAGVCCWLLFWFGVSHLDSIPYLNKYLTRRMVLDWVAEHPVTSLLLTEGVNVLFHGLGSASSVFFTFAGTITNAAVIFLFLPTMRWSANSLTKAADYIDAHSSTLNVPAKEVA